MRRAAEQDKRVFRHGVLFTPHGKARAKPCNFVFFNPI